MSKGRDIRQNTDKGDCGCGGKGCGSGGPGKGMARRRFMQVTGLGMLATTQSAFLEAMAGPFGENDMDSGHLVPADKRLDPGWLKSLHTRGIKEVYRGKALENIGMPCGGIGSGQLYLCGDGTLGCWQIFNNAVSNWVANTHSTYTHRGIAKPVKQGFAVTVREGGGEAAQWPLSSDGFADVSFTGEYPIATIRYADPESPVKIEMEAFSPFIPLNAADSGLPATLYHITLENVSRRNVYAGLLGWLENAVCLNYGQQYPGLGRTRITQGQNGTMILHSAEELPPSETPPPPLEERPAILFEDFEGGDYGAWVAEGEAFGAKPAKGTLDNQNPVTGYLGEQLVNTFLGGDGPQGTLTSPAFTIERRYINFLIGGGNYAERTCMNLMVDGAVARTATGKNSEALEWAAWDVSELEGKEARLVIVDAESGGWGHINIDHIEFADTPRSGAEIAMDKAPDFGTMAFASPEAVPGSDGLLPENAGAFLCEGDTAFDIKESHCGLLRSRETLLRPGQKTTVTFVLAWHFPNQVNGQAYTARFADAREVAEYVLEEHARLTEQTRRWRDTYYDSTLPYWLLDRLHSTLSYLATGTCQWWANGRFWAYEGVTCCHGTCTHVWNYAHGHARLFPELARSVREMQDFNPREHGGGFHPDTGLVGFRSDDNYAADGQCGTILKAYREHLTSPDDAFLRANWPMIRKALEYTIAQDEDEDGLIENLQHNTYDINYFGPNTFVGALYLAALRAGEEMARVVGDTTFAERARVIFASGRKLTLERLWNGEYFVQEVDLDQHPKHQYKDGCLSDHLFGQGWAHQLGLGDLYPRDKVLSALRAIWKYNWAPDIKPYNDSFPPFRWFISPGQAGLITCTWPKSEHLKEGTLYAEEVWTGIEYQVAGHMIWEGMIDEGLVLCRAVHDRYHPELFNPYNEVECGDHYARALASWGVYLALAGFEYHGPKGIIGFAPRISPDQFRAAFTAAEGWGAFEQQRKAASQHERIEIHYGRLRVNTLHFTLPEGQGAKSVRVVLNNVKTLDAETQSRDDIIEIALAREQTLQEGDTLDVKIRLHG